MGISANGSTFVTGSGIVDSSADLLGYLAWQDVFQSGVGSYLPLEKVSDDGSTVFLPNVSFVDIFDLNRGTRIHRLSLSERVLQVTDALEIDPNGQSVYLVTNMGLTIVNLGSVSSH